MKTVLLSLCCLSLLSAVPALAADINGIWKSDTSTFIFYQEGSKIKVLCAYKWEKRQPIVWSGEGSISGNRVTYRLHHTSNLAPAGWEDGVHELTLADDGATMQGNWKTVSDSAGGKMAALRRIGP